MERDLDRSSLYDKSLALRSGYYGGRELGAPGRGEEGWRERAVAPAVDLLAERGWQVRPGPDLSSDVEPGGILSGSTEVLGSLWARRYGQEVAVVVRVDDCGEIYCRLAGPNDIVSPERGLDLQPSEAPVSGEDALQRHPIIVGDALEHLLCRPSDGPAFGWGMEL
jgi:hypothetical protein